MQLLRKLSKDCSKGEACCVTDFNNLVITHEKKRHSEYDHRNISMIICNKDSLQRLIKPIDDF